KLVHLHDVMGFWKKPGDIRVIPSSRKPGWRVLSVNAGAVSASNSRCTWNEYRGGRAIPADREGSWPACRWSREVYDFVLGLGALRRNGPAGRGASNDRATAHHGAPVRST